MSLWLIGAGPMAQAYAKILISRGIPFEVIGRGKASGAEFTRAIGVPVRIGGLEDALRNGQAPGSAIVAVGVEALAGNTEALVKAGARRILLEKPGGLNVAQLEALKEKAIKADAEIWLAYNRRFHAATLAVERAIAEDGGATSIQFEFTEWSHVIQSLAKGPGVKEHWLMGNSTHVIDLAFHLGGIPVEWKGWHSGSLDWHPASARFCGAGVTDRGVLFSYLADWEAPGRWGVEVLTRKRRLILRPMEQLQVTSLGSVKIEPVEIDDRLDRDFKPGLYRQTAAFLSGDTERLCSLEQQVRNARLYSEIAGYPVS